MFNVSGWGSFLYETLWRKEAEFPAEKIIFELDELEVKVDLNPIGGYRGKIGTLSINHKDHKIFTNWSDKNLQTLAKLERMILYIREQEHVSNTLIFGRQDLLEEFKLSFVAYPKCNWIEKIQGLIHVIFGSPVLTEKEADEIAQFYQDKFDETLDIPVEEGKSREGKPDAFCRDSVIEEQKIKDLALSDIPHLGESGDDDYHAFFIVSGYHLLHDNRPKGASSTDPHFLIVPKGDSGHCDGSQVSQDKRYHMLRIAQQAMLVFVKEKYSTFLFLERNGEELQGVQHKHCHVIGIQDFPVSFLDKLRVLMRQVYTPILSNLKDRIPHYQEYDWKQLCETDISEYQT